MVVVVVVFANGEIDLNAWRGRTIYFVVTDRFATGGAPGAVGCGGKGWCGGTIKGVEQKLDYIQAKNASNFCYTT